MRLLAASVGLALACASPLWDYVNVVDPAYKWFQTGYNITVKGTPGWSAHLLNMTSGSWMKPSDSSRYIWTHQVRRGGAPAADIGFAIACAPVEASNSLRVRVS